MRKKEEELARLSGDNGEQQSKLSAADADMADIKSQLAHSNSSKEALTKQLQASKEVSPPYSFRTAKRRNRTLKSHPIAL